MDRDAEADPAEGWYSDRRQFVRTVGAVGAIGTAGCTGVLDDETGDDADPEPVAFEVDGLTPGETEIDAGDPLSASATVTNAGDEEGTETLGLRVGDEELAVETVTLDGGTDGTVTFEDVDTAGVDPGEHEFGVYGDEDAATGPIAVREGVPYSAEVAAGERADVFHDGDRVARYVYEYDPEDDYENTFKPYLHVWDPDLDEPLTSDPSQGGEYDHHRGIFIGWNEIEVDGQHVDSWHEEPIVHQQFDPPVAEFESEGTLTSVTHWLTEPDGEVYLVETREMRFREPPAENGIVTVDCTFTLSFETDVDLTGDPEHGGIQYRAHDDVYENGSAEYYFSDHWERGENPGQGDVDEVYGYDWVGMECTMHDREYFVHHVNHPDNPDETTYSAYRDYGRFGAYWEDSFEAGDEITVAYRIAVQRGDAPDEGTLDERHADFAEEA